MMTRLLSVLAIAGLVACEPVTNSADNNVASQTPVTGFMGITGTVIKIEDFKSDYVIPRHIEIWLPPSYEHETEKVYPVLYMHDGQNIFDPKQSQYSQTDWGVDEAMTQLIAEGKVREAIVVGAWSTHKRNPEYFPEKAAKAYPDRFSKEFPDFDADKIESDDYLKFLVEELKPYIDAQYRTQPERENSFMMGSSMGGLISAYALSEYPNIFGGAACVSTHFPLGDGAIVEYLSDKLPDPETHKLYFDYGTETLDHNYEPYQNRMDAALKSAGYIEGESWITRKFEGHEHSERAWRARVHVPLEFLLGVDK